MTPASGLGFDGAGRWSFGPGLPPSLDAGVPKPRGWPLGTLCLRAQIHPCLLQGHRRVYLGQSPYLKQLVLSTLCPMFFVTERIFYNNLILTLCASFFCGRSRTILIPALPAAAEAHVDFLPALPPSFTPWAGPPIGPVVPYVGAHQCLQFPFFWRSPKIEAGPLCILWGPWFGQGHSAGHYANTALEASMDSDVGTGSGPLTPLLDGCSPKEQNQLFPPA